MGSTDKATMKRERGRQVKPELDGKVAIAAALADVLRCSAIEGARLIAQAEPDVLQKALHAVPIDCDLVLEAISRGAYAVAGEQLTLEDTAAQLSATRTFPTPESGVLTVAMQQQRAAHIRGWLRQQTERTRNGREQSPTIERDALAISQGQKNRRTRGVDNSELVAALTRALIEPARDAANRKTDGAAATVRAPSHPRPEPWTIG